MAAPVKELVMTMLTTHPEQTAGTIGPPDKQVYAVVGFDGSASAQRALDAAARLLNDRPGGMQIVFVAHLPALSAAGDVAGLAAAEVLQGFDDAARELSGMVRAHLQATHLRAAAQRWHFQRRDGAIADQLIAVADDLRRQHGPDASVVIVVGRSEHGYHHVLGSVPQALERHVHYPVIVIP
jgi:nucleotide-binding universal stress UspA family protein